MHFLLTDFMLPNTMTPQIPGLCGSTVRGTVGLCIIIYIFQYIYLRFTFWRSLSDLRAKLWAFPTGPFSFSQGCLYLMVIHWKFFQNLLLICSRNLQKKKFTNSHLEANQIILYRSQQFQSPCLVWQRPAHWEHNVCAALGGVPNPLKLWPLTSFKFVNATWYFFFQFLLFLHLLFPFLSISKERVFLQSSPKSLFFIQCFQLSGNSVLFNFDWQPHVSFHTHPHYRLVFGCSFPSAFRGTAAAFSEKVLNKLSDFRQISFSQHLPAALWLWLSSQFQLETARSQDWKYQTGLFQPLAVS